MGKLVDTDNLLENCDKFLVKFATKHPNKFFDKQGVRHLIKLLCETTPTTLEPIKYAYAVKNSVNNNCR